MKHWLTTTFALLGVLTVHACDFSSPASLGEFPEQSQYEQVTNLLAGRFDPDEVQGVVDRLSSILGRTVEVEVEANIPDPPSPSGRRRQIGGRITISRVDDTPREASVTARPMTVSAEWFEDEVVVCYFDSGGNSAAYDAYTQCAEDYLGVCAAGIASPLGSHSVRAIRRTRWEGLAEWRSSLENEIG